MRRILLPALSLIWLAAAVVGMRTMAHYESTAGLPAVHGDAWPRSAALHRAEGRPTLILFAHPRCPCTRATLDELDEVVTRFGGRVKVIVAFYRPSGEAPGWERTDLWDHASSIPGAEVVADPDGAQARAFGARTSGQVLLFDASGRSQFRGGITSVRGLVGDNAGLRAIIALIAGRRAETATAPVFGCSLF